MKKLLLVILLLFTLMACEEAEEQADIAEVVALEYVNEYINTDIEHYLIDVVRVDYVYHEGQLQPIQEEGLYGTYFFFTFYYEFSGQNIVTKYLVELWYETEAKEAIKTYNVINI